MAKMKTFDMKNHFLYIGTTRIKGYMPGASPVKWEPDATSWNKIFGPDGEVARAGTGVTSGKFTVSIQMTAELNQLLSNIHNADVRGGGKGLLPIIMKDVNGLDLITSEDCYIEGPPSAEYGDEITGRDWVIEHGAADWNFGGAL